ncbi:hypothetical protein ES708_10661 [subsurface metagenome]
MTTYTENQGIARTFIPQLISTGYTANKALGFLKTQNLGYRRTSFLADWREFTGREAKKDVIKYIRKDYKPTTATMSTTTDNLRDQYKYVYKIKGRDSITGEEKELSWAHTTDELMTMKDVEDIIEEDIKIEEYESGITDMELVPGEILSRVKL